MASIDQLVSRLDLKLRSLHQEQSLATKAGKTGILEQPFLSEYIQLTTTAGIVPGVEFIALDVLSKHFSLYEDDRERQQIFAAMADELNDAAPSNILASIQIVQNLYPSIYLLGEQQLILTRDRTNDNAKGFATSINPPIIDPPSPSSHPTPAPTTPTTTQPPLATAKVSQPKSGLLIGFCIVSAVIGGAIASSFNKAPIASPPNSVNNPQSTNTTSTPSNSIVNDSSTTKTIPNTSTQARPSPAQAIRDHYQALNAHNYDLTWDNLSSRFKTESGNSSKTARKEYEEWWNSVRSIDLQRAETASISGDGSTAVVNYRHGYTMNSGRFVQDKHTQIFLRWDEAKGKWLIDKRS